MTDPNTHKPSPYFDPDGEPIPYPEEAMPENRIESTSAASASNVVPLKNEAKHPWLDLNHNGIPDYEEPWLWRFVWGAFSFAVRVFAPPHTIIARGVNAVEQARSQLPPM